MNQNNNIMTPLIQPVKVRINFDPHWRQWQAWQFLFDSFTTSIGYGGAGNGGKSYLGAVWIMIMAKKYAGTRWAIGRKELKNLKRTTLATFWKVCRQFRLKAGVDYIYNQQDQIIRFPHYVINEAGEGETIYSEVLLLDLKAMPSDPLFTELGGLELTGAWVDESNEVSVLAINILASRCGRCENEKYGLFPKLLETFNPDKGHVYSRFYKPWRNGIEGKAPSLPAFRQFIQSLPKDNPYCTKAWIDQILNSGDKILIERLIKGNFEYDDDPMALFEPDSMEDMFTLNVTPKPELDEAGNIIKPIEKFVSVDVARFGADRTIIKIWYGLQVKKVHIMQKASTAQVASKLMEIAEAEKIPRSHFVIDEDGIGGGVIDQFSGCKGFLNNSSAVQPPQAEHDQNLRVNYQNLKTQCYYKLAEYVAAGKIGYDKLPPEIKEQIKEELQAVKRKNADKDGKLQINSKDEQKELLGRSPDFGDALMMRMYFELRPKRKFSFTSLG